MVDPLTSNMNEILGSQFPSLQADFDTSWDHQQAAITPHDGDPGPSSEFFGQHTYSHAKGESQDLGFDLNLGLDFDSGQYDALSSPGMVQYEPRGLADAWGASPPRTRHARENSLAATMHTPLVSLSHLDQPLLAGGHSPVTPKNQGIDSNLYMNSSSPHLPTSARTMSSSSRSPPSSLTPASSLAQHCVTPRGNCLATTTSGQVEGPAQPGFYGPYSPRTQGSSGMMRHIQGLSGGSAAAMGMAMDSRMSPGLSPRSVMRPMLLQPSNCTIPAAPGMPLGAGPQQPDLQSKHQISASSPKPQSTMRRRIPPQQAKHLEESFEKNPLPDRSERERLVSITGLKMRNIQIWFQNRRAKRKAQAAAKAQIGSQEKSNGSGPAHVTAKAIGSTTAPSHSQAPPPPSRPDTKTPPRMHLNSRPASAVSFSSFASMQQSVSSPSRSRTPSQSRPSMSAQPVADGGFYFPKESHSIPYGTPHCSASVENQLLQNLGGSGCDFSQFPSSSLKMQQSPNTGGYSDGYLQNSPDLQKWDFNQMDTPISSFDGRANRPYYNTQSPEVLVRSKSAIGLPSEETWTFGGDLKRRRSNATIPSASQAGSPIQARQHRAMRSQSYTQPPRQEDSRGAMRLTLDDSSHQAKLVLVPAASSPVGDRRYGRSPSVGNMSNYASLEAISRSASRALYDVPEEEWSKK